MEDHVSGQVAKVSEVRCRAINLGTIPQHVTQKAEKINGHVEGRPDASCRGPTYYSKLNFSVFIRLNELFCRTQKNLPPPKHVFFCPYSGIFAAFRNKVQRYKRNAIYLKQTEPGRIENLYF
jgi:hypothetical protein